MAKNFGNKVKNLRHEKGVTREELCGDETELSIRQLARIESGQSSPSILKVKYIAQQLGVSVGSLTDGENLELPKRYKELKYLILRTPTYDNGQKVELKEQYIDEIYNSYYDQLPEEEQLVIDSIQSKLDVHFSSNIDFGKGLLEDYFIQIKRKKEYKINDLVLIDLYLTCAFYSGFDSTVFDIKTYDELINQILMQTSTVNEDLFVVNNVLLNHFDIMFHFKKSDFLKRLIEKSTDIMEITHDYHKMPILKMIEWKFYIYMEPDKKRAEQAYQKSILYCDLTNDDYLKGQLQGEWTRDCRLE